MGSEIEAERRAVPSIEVKGSVSGTAPIARVVAVLNGRDAEELNFLAPADGSALIRLVMTNTTDPGGERSKIRPPLPKQHWWGKIAFGKTPIVSATPIGIDGPGDTFRQVNTRRVDFACTVTGDEDGVLVELDEWDDQDTVTIEVFAAEKELWQYETAPQPMWGENNSTLVKKVRIRLADLDRGPQRQTIDDRSSVVVERVGANLPAWQEFSFTLTDGVKPDGDNYVYIRAQQIDDEMAWSSPVWVSWRE